MKRSFLVSSRRESAGRCFLSLVWTRCFASEIGSKHGSSYKHVFAPLSLAPGFCPESQSVGVEWSLSTRLARFTVPCVAVSMASLGTVFGLLSLQEVLESSSCSITEGFSPCKLLSRSVISGSRSLIVKMDDRRVLSTFSTSLSLRSGYSLLKLFVVRLGRGSSVCGAAIAEHIESRESLELCKANVLLRIGSNIFFTMLFALPIP